MKKILIILLAALLLAAVLTGCGSTGEQEENDTASVPAFDAQENKLLNSIVLTDEIIDLADGFSAVRHTGDYGFDLFLEQGGATSDSEVVSFLMDNVMSDIGSLLFGGNPFGCSTLSVQNANGDSLFGRNFDWNTCNAMIVQNQPDITTTTAIRLLLDKAANVDEAIELLNSYDLHASFGYMVHFAIADRAGNSVVVEYVNNEPVVTETPAVTNFYLAEGEKNGISTAQPHERYEILMNRLAGWGNKIISISAGN